MTQRLDALLGAWRLKRLLRAGWLRHGIIGPESVAAHSWGVSLLVLSYLPEELQLGRALTYAAVHDLAEAEVGDITPHDGVSQADKHAAESQAIQAITKHLPEHLLRAWNAYEAQRDAESRFVRECDRLDMVIQAVHYAEAGAVGMQDFLDSAAPVITTPTLRALFNEAQARMQSRSGTQAHKQSQGPLDRPPSE